MKMVHLHPENLLLTMRLQENLIEDDEVNSQSRFSSGLATRRHTTFHLADDYCFTYRKTFDV